MTPMRIMVLDDDETRHAAFDRAFSADVLEHTWTYWDAVALLENSQAFDVVYLDHDLGDTEDAPSVAGMYGDVELTGADVARFICRELEASKRPARAVVHSWNVVGAATMVAMLRGAGIPCSHEPFQPPQEEGT